MTSQAPLPSSFDKDTTALQVVEGLDLTGRVYVVTGGYSGIGVETTRALSHAGATVVVPTRNRDKANTTLAGIDRVELVDLDLADLDSARRAAATITAKHPVLNGLINNAGVMANAENRLGPGWESQFAVNHLGHVVFTRGLLPSLLAAGDARVVCLSSTAHRMSPIRFDDPSFTSGSYQKWVAYGQSKTANSLFAIALDARYRDQGLRAFAVHPGGIQTDLQRHLALDEMIAMGWCDAEGNLTPEAATLFKSVEAGAATSVWCAVHPELAGHGGVYCEDCDIASLASDASAPYADVRPHAVDSKAAERLWELTDRMLSEGVVA